MTCATYSRAALAGAQSGAHWRMLPHDFPRLATVYQQSQRWFKAGWLEATAHDLRVRLRLAAGREPAPTTAVMDSRRRWQTSHTQGKGQS